MNMPLDVATISLFNKHVNMKTGLFDLQSFHHAIKELKKENEWLWYSHIDIEDDTHYMTTMQYDKKGNVIAVSTSMLPPKKHRVKPPKPIKE
jgi:hypothetical protein